MRQDELKLHCGREIALCSIEQHRVYEGLLEGLPTRQSNRGLLASLQERARALLPGVAPYLIAPTEVPIDWDGDRPYPFGEPAALPRVACTARFGSRRGARDPDAAGSQLVVIWLQDEFAFPIDADVLEQLRAIAWERVAGDVEY